MALQVNDLISPFTLSDASGKTWTFPTDASRLTVLYFYPKDNTKEGRLKKSETPTESNHSKKPVLTSGCPVIGK